MISDTPVVFSIFADVFFLFTAIPTKVVFFILFGCIPKVCNFYPLYVTNLFFKFVS